jgi:predicted DNA-binding ArsR family transcriptional regulator
MRKITTKQFIEELQNIRKKQLEEKTKEWMTVAEIAHASKLGERKCRKALQILNDAGALKVKKITVSTGLMNTRKSLAHFNLKNGLDIVSVIKKLKIIW